MPRQGNLEHYAHCVTLLGDIKVGATGLPANSGALKRVEVNGCSTAPNDCPRLEVVSGLNRPTSVAIAPDGSIYVTNNGTSPSAGGGASHRAVTTPVTSNAYENKNDPFPRSDSFPARARTRRISRNQGYWLRCLTSQLQVCSGLVPGCQWLQVSRKLCSSRRLFWKGTDTHRFPCARKVPAKSPAVPDRP